MLDEDLVIPDGTDVVFCAGSVVDLNGKTLTIGKNGSITFEESTLLRDDPRITGSGWIYIGENVRFIVPDGEFPGIQSYGITIQMDGTLTVDCEDRIEPANNRVNVRYVPSGGDIEITFASANDSRLFKADRLSFNYEYSNNAQRQLEDMIKGDKTFEQMLDGFLVTDTINVSIGFGRFTIEERIINGSDYTFTRAVGTSSSQSDSFDILITKAGVSFVSTSLNSVEVTEGSTTSLVVRTTSLTGISDPHLDFNASTLTLSVGAAELRLASSGGAGAYDARFHNASVSVSATISVDFHAEDIFSIITISRADIGAHAESADITSGGSSFSLGYTSADAVFESSQLLSLNFVTNYDGKDVSIVASGFDMEITDRPDGKADVHFTITSITLNFGDHSFVVNGVDTTLSNFDISVIIQRISSSGEVHLQDLLDSCDTVTITASRITYEPGTTATLESVTITLWTESGKNCMNIQVGAANGYLDMSPSRLEFVMSPSTIIIRSDCSLTAAEYALTRGYTFTADSEMQFEITTERIEVKLIDDPQNTRSILSAAIVPDSGSISFTFLMKYTKADDDMQISFNVNLASAVITLSGQVDLEGNGEFSKAEFRATHPVINMNCHFKSKGDGTQLSVAGSIRADSQLNIKYFGITVNANAVNARLDIGSLQIDVGDFDCSKNGILPVLASLTDHDFHATLSSDLKVDSVELRTDESIVSNYTNVDVNIGKADLDLKHNDALRLGIESVDISARNSSGELEEKHIRNFTYMKDLSPEKKGSDVPYIVLAVIFGIGIVAVWALIVRDIMQRRGKGGSAE